MFIHHRRIFMIKLINHPINKNEHSTYIDITFSICLSSIIDYFYNNTINHPLNKNIYSKI